MHIGELKIFTGLPISMNDQKHAVCIDLELQINWQMHKHRIMDKDQLNHVHKGQKYYIVLISTEKSFDNIQHAF